MKLVKVTGQPTALHMQAAVTSTTCSCRVTDQTTQMHTVVASMIPRDYGRIIYDGSTMRII